MVVHKGEKAGQEARIGMAILIGVFVLPAISPEKTAWLTGFIPLPVFYYLICSGKREGLLLIRNAVLVAGCVAVLTNGLPLLLFSLTLVPLGFIFYRAAQNGDSPARAGFDGMLFLGAAWLLFWTCFGLLAHTNPYAELLDALDQGLAGALTAYRGESGLSASAWQSFEATVNQIRTLLPRVLPSLLITGLLSTVWTNQALGNWLLKRKNQALAPWPDFRNWQLPDHLVWGFILGATLLLMPAEVLKTIGLNILIVWGAFYCIQGAAVLAGLLNRWALPRPLRIILFAFVIIQTFGIILLAFLGLADVWGDFRKIRTTHESPKTHI